MQGLELVAAESGRFKGQGESHTLASLVEESSSAGGGREQGVVVMEVCEGKKDGGKKPSSVPPVGFTELFRFADRLDYILMGIGTVGSLIHGCSLPIFLRVFTELVISFGSYANNVDKMVQEVLKYSFYFLVVGAAIWVSSWAEISYWMWTGE